MSKNEKILVPSLVLCVIFIVFLLGYTYSIPPDNESEPVADCKSFELTIDRLKDDLEYCKRCREANNKSLDLRKRDFNTIRIKLLECREAYQFILSHCEDY